VPSPPDTGDRERVRPGPAPALTVQGIAAAAVSIADRDGLPAVTMRSVAAALDTSAPGLYRYVTSRDELLAQMVDLVSATVEHPPPTGDWLADLQTVAESQRAVFRAHPWLTHALDGTVALGPHVLDHLDWGLEVLAEVPATDGQKLDALALANGIAALFSAAGPGGGRGAFAHLNGRRHPRLIAALAGVTDPTSASDPFPRVLAAVLHATLGTTPDATPKARRPGRSDA
jgi:AcrR family transcriptional regulator